MVCENSRLHQGPQLPVCTRDWDGGTSSTAAVLPGAHGVVDRSQSLWEERQWLPALTAGLSQRKRKPVSTLRIVYLMLQCNCVKYHITSLYSVFWWWYSSRTLRSVSGSPICGGTCSWKVAGLCLWWKQVTYLPHCISSWGSGSGRLVAVGFGTGLVCAWCHSTVPMISEVTDFCSTVSQRACSHRCEITILTIPSNTV